MRRVLKVRKDVKARRETAIMKSKKRLSHLQMEIEPQTSEKALVRQLTLLPLFCIIVANMVGSGIFTTSGFIIQDVENPSAMLLCWLIGGLLSLTGGLCYGELGAMFPSAGGDYVFLRESFGKQTAFLSGWISLWVGFSAPIAAVAIAFGNYFNAVLPMGIQSPKMSSILAVSVIVVFTWVHIQGLGFGSWMQNITTFIKILIIVSLIVIGLTWGIGSFQHFEVPLSYSNIFSEKFATSLIFVSFAYSGWNTSVYVGSEIKNPERNIPASIINATIFVIFIYLLLNIVYVYAIHPKAMSGVEEIGSMAALNLFGEKIGTFFGLAIALSLLSTVSSMIMIGPRVYYAMACDQVFLKIFQSINRTHRVPSYSIILQGGISITLVLTSTFYTILLYTGFMLAIFSSLTVLGMMVLRWKDPDRRRPYKTWGYPLTPIIFIIGNLWIVIFSVRNNSTAFMWGLATVAAGWLIYEYFEGWFKNRLIFGKKPKSKS
jgi:APA family basic amino acid/polyamine antiporter